MALVLNLHFKGITYFYTAQSSFLKKLGKILRYTVLVLVLLLISLWLLIQTRFVQDWLIHRVSSRLSKDLKTEISIRHVDFAFFNQMLIQGLLVKDLHHDTLVYAGTVSVRITDWFFLKNRADLKYIGLKNANIFMSRDDSVWNYQFLVDYFSSPQPSEKNGIALNLKKMDLSNIHFLKRDGWRGEDMELRLKSLTMEADSVSFVAKKAHIRSLKIVQPNFSITAYTGRRTLVPQDTVPINDPAHLRWNPGGWDLSINEFKINKGSFRNENRESIPAIDHFDGSHLYFYAIDWDFHQLKINRDTITAKMELSTREKSGFEVKKFSSEIKFFPEAMEFHAMDIQTGKSRLRNFFAMRFSSFDDMSDFIHKVRMEADFAGADIDSDDIGFFAPDLKDWKKKIRITGNIKGPVDNLEGKNVLINAGQNTFLNGDIHLKGLPDIDHTFIDFKSNHFRTTYRDIITFIPSLRKLRQPRIDRIEQLSFTGQFTGYIHDFVTSGKLVTNLGTITSNLNMKLPDSKAAIYTGSIKTDSFDLGKFMDDESLGKFSFEGKVNGRGLVAKTLNASLDGKVNRLDFNGYSYYNINVNGNVSKRKFNGSLVAVDSNLNASLNGLIDFSHDQPKFDFSADISKSNLRSLNFTKDNVAFNGKLRFNFVGNDIDNFLGTARIYDASVYKNGQRISFDSLSLESSIIDSNKTITVISNEFDGAIVGSFSIKELPAAFQTFLNRYYPSYIKPSTTKLSNQNFSFVITTKKVDDYIDFFDKNIKGLNYTNITGRIDTKNNLLDLNAEVPQVSFKNISFYKVNLKGRGNFDSLAMETNIGEVYVSDSLHFPSTHIQFRSFNDISDVQIKTSANQTLNAANISAKVQTLSDGVRITFNPSTFDINSKTWTIDRNGELAFSKDIVAAEGLKIYADNQQILITTHPSSEGSWNDIHVDLKKVNIGDFSPFVVKSERVEGLLTGSVDISDPFRHTYAQFSGEAEQFRFNNDSIGTMKLTANYNKVSGLVNATVRSNNKDYHFDLRGIFNTADSAKQPINIDIPNLVDTRVNLLERYLGGVFSNVSGFASGHLQIAGPGGQLKYIGDITLKDASLKVNYTQCTYKIPVANIQLRDGYMDFGSFALHDTLGNTAEMSKARLYHSSFKDLRYDFDLSTSRLLMLNTRITDNNQFFGTMIGKARMTLTGPGEDMQMYIRGEPVDSSNLYLPTTTSRESTESDFIVWRVYGKEMKPIGRDETGTNFTVTLDITANNYANVYVIIDPLTKDIIKANGHGNLHLKVGTTEDMDIRGRYEIDRGSYSFSFQSFIRKPFIFKEGVGNYIQWTGNPYDADINIQAIYEADNVQFADLGYNLVGGASESEKLKSYHSKIWVIATLSEKLMHPAISFEIGLPPNSELRNNGYVTLMFQQIESDPNELNKQVAYLLVFNSFGPLQNSTVAAPTLNQGVSSIFVNSISSAISSVLSSQFSNAFQKIFNDKSIKVNFNTTFYNGSSIAEQGDPTRNYDRTNLNLSVIKSFLNERLTFTVGSAMDFGITAQQVQAASFQFLPNITMDYKITPNGRVVLSFFYRDSYNYLAAGNHTQNSSGTSISYRRDFDRLDELFKSKKKDKQKKEKKKDTDSTKEVTKAE
jgi:hypothetical protein